MGEPARARVLDAPGDAEETRDEELERVELGLQEVEVAPGALYLSDGYGDDDQVQCTYAWRVAEVRYQDELGAFCVGDPWFSNDS